MARDHIRIAESLKYLGVTVEEYMKFSTHVLDIVERIRKLMSSLAKLARVNCGYGCKSLTLNITLSGKDTTSSPIWL